MNRVINKYGALEHSTPEGKAIEHVCDDIRHMVNDTCYVHNFSPEEIIAFEHYVSSAMGSAFAENVLKKAFIIKKYEEIKKSRSA
jgi:hypothetical protein